jgi:signal transduction histidine kinase
MRRVFLLYGTALVSAVLVAFLFPLGLLASSLAHDRALEAGRQEAQGLTVIANTASRERLSEAVDALNAGPRRTTVFLPDGTRLGYGAPRTPSVRLAQRGHAFTATTRGGVELLQPVGGADGVAVIRTFVPEHLLTDGVRTAWATLTLVGLTLLAASIVVGDRIAARLSRSVTELAVVAEKVGSGDLRATVTPAGPREVASVGRVLNHLGARIAEMLADERQLGADLSHRLRTPVTALRLDVESLRDPEERRQMAGHVDNLVAAVDAAVEAARHPAHVRADERCDAARVVSDRARFWRVLADETQRPLRVEVPAGSAVVPVSADDLGAALDALVDNVFSHTPARTPFALGVHTSATGATDVFVEDSGPGLAPESARRGVSGAGSTGIGLDVARRTALQGGGAFRVERSGSGGARLVLSFQPPTFAHS